MWNTMGLHSVCLGDESAFSFDLVCFVSSSPCLVPSLSSLLYSPASVKDRKKKKMQENSTKYTLQSDCTTKCNNILE